MARETEQDARSGAEAADDRRADRAWLLGLLALVGLFLAPYLVLGRVMLPLELLAVFQPWARQPEVFGERLPPPLNPLLDALQQYYPRRDYFTGALREGWLPFWNPYVYGGSPFLTAQQGGVFYPPAWLLAVLPPAAQFGASALLHLYLAAAGAYLFLRQVGLRPPAAGGGAVAFALNGFVVVWLSYPNVTQWTLSWLPAILWAWERGRRARDPRWVAGAAGFLALCVLGGHFQSTAYVFLAWAAWALARVLAEERRPAGLLAGLLGWVATPALLALLLSAAHLLPALEWVPETDRGGRLSWADAVRTGMPPAQLWGLVLPRLFGDGTLAFSHQHWLPAGDRAGLAYVERSFYPGVVVLALAGAALGARLRGRRLLLGYGLALSVLALLWALGTEAYRPLWLLPGFGQFTAIARIVCLAGWGLALLAALGLDGLAAEDAAAARRAARGLALGALLVALVALAGWYIHGSAIPQGLSAALRARGRPPVETLFALDLARACLLPALGVLVFLLPRLRGAPGEKKAAAVVGLVALDLFSFGFPFNPRADPAILRATTPELTALAAVEEPFRFLAASPTGADADLRDRMPSNLPSTYRLADIAGSDSFVTRRYREWEAATREATGGASPWARRPSPNLRSAGVSRYLVSPRDGLALPEAGAPGLRRDDRALPYARVHPNAQRQASREELLHHLAHPGRVPEVALTLDPALPTFSGPTTALPLAARRPNGNRLSVTGTSLYPGLLVVCEQYDRGWTARVNGRPTPVGAADHLLTATPVPAGAIRAEFTYVPTGLRVGLFLSLAALAVGVAGLLGLRPAPRGEGGARQVASSRPPNNARAPGRRPADGP